MPSLRFVDVRSVHELRIGDVVLGVDWTGLPPLLELRRAGAVQPPTVPFVYLNFRVHAASTGISAEDARFYEQRESEALHAATVSVALCRADAALLRAMPSHAAGGREEGRTERTRRKGRV